MAFFNIATFCSLFRLNMKGIFGINPTLLLSAGNVSVLCFDKTGTLTNSWINIWGIWTKEKGSVPAQKIQAESKRGMLYRILSTCHSVAYYNNELIGDPIDVKMLEFSGYTYDFEQKMGKQTSTVVHNAEETIEILKVFEFHSEFQSMSVLIQPAKEENKLYFCMKGAPEKLKLICSDIPPEYDAVINKLSISGFRILALAYKEIQAPQIELSKLNRNQFENNLMFMGFLIVDNPLKTDTKQVLAELIECDYNIKIISGNSLARPPSEPAAHCHLCETPPPRPGRTPGVPPSFHQQAGVCGLVPALRGRSGECKSS